MSKGMSARRHVRALAALGLTGFAVLAPATAAPAQEVCYPPPCTPGISDRTVRAGQLVTVTSGTGRYRPGEAVEYGLGSADQQTGQATADDSGAVVVTLRLPAMPPGRHHVVFTSLVGGGQVRVPFQLVHSTTAEQEQEQALVAAAGPGMVVAGAGVLLALRRRRQRLLG